MVIGTSWSIKKGLEICPKNIGFDFAYYAYLKNMAEKGTCLSANALDEVTDSTKFMVYQEKKTEYLVI